MTPPDLHHRLKSKGSIAIPKGMASEDALRLARMARDWLDAVEERSAIMEYLAGHTRTNAEALALDDNPIPQEMEILL